MKLKRMILGVVIVVPTALFLAIFVAYWMSDNSCPDSIAAPTNPMKAIIYCEYGTAEILRYADIEKPSPGEHEILVKVHAAGLNPYDWHFMRGTPYIMRLESGLRKPRFTQLGVDFAGTVEAVGSNVTRFKPGDGVFGGRSGSLAEYLIVHEDRAVALKPAEVTFEQAASIGIAAITALQGLRDRGRLQEGQSVLINGASGGVGTFAVQIANGLGAHVTGVSSTRNQELVRSIGADEVIDYTQADFTQGTQRYDLVLDNVGNYPLLDVRRVLKPKGRYILIGGGGPDAGDWIGPLAGPIKALVLSWFVSQELGSMMAELNQEDLNTIGDLIQSGKVIPVIDRRYSLSEVPDAIRYMETGRARGKVIITLE